MATTKEINKFLKESGYTYEDMQKFWNDCINTNTTVKLLSNSGINWNDMNISVIRKLPTQKERDIEYIKSKEEENKLKEEKEVKEKEEEEYYINHFEEIIVNKIDNKEKLTRDELSEIIFSYEVDSEYGDNRRWSRTVSTVVELCGRFFMVDWEEGLTESQENEYYNQPYEVKKHTYEKTITVTEWLKVGDIK